MQYPWLLEGHKIFRVVIVIQLLIAIGIGFYTGEILPAFVLGIPIAVVPLVLSLQKSLFSDKSPCDGYRCSIANSPPHPPVIRVN